MTTFRIDAENNITAFASSEQIEESGGETETFTSQQELAQHCGKVARCEAGRDLEQLAGSRAGAAVHQPAGRRDANLEGHSGPCNRPCFRTTCGGQEIDCPQEGAASSAKTSRGPQQDCTRNRDARAARRRHAARNHASDRVADAQRARFHQWPLKEEAGSESPLLQARGRTCVLHPTQIVMVWEAGHRSPGFTLLLVRSSWRGYFQSKPAG